jgi:glutamate dehydrogenase/leucine dehydrogenase
MSAHTIAPRTPITAKADRSHREIRLLEEAILMIRGQWPAAATGICMSFNTLFGFSLGGARDRQRLVDENVEEVLRLVEALYGKAAVDEVYRRAGAL